MMNREQRKRFEAFTRVRELGRRHPAQFPQGTRCHELLTELSDVIDQLEITAARKINDVSATSQLTTGRNEIRDQVMAQMTAINRTARSIARVRKGFDQPFKMPARCADLDLVTVARAFVKAVEPLQADFIREEMPADFLTRLQESLMAFAQMISSQRNAMQDQSATNDEIAQKVVEGMDILHRLAGPMHNRLSSNEKLLVKWEKARRLDRAGKATTGAVTETVEEAETETEETMASEATAG